jgi:hypothetical protein
MPTIMVTRNLWRAIGGRAKLATRRPDDDDRAKLSAWSLREFPTSAGYLVVGLEETTYLTVICPILVLPDFTLSFAASVATALETLGIPDGVVHREISHIIEHSRFARNDNRSLLGSVNDVAFHASVLLEQERTMELATLERVRTKLNQMPHVNRSPAFPDQATRLLFMPAQSRS